VYQLTPLLEVRGRDTFITHSARWSRRRDRTLYYDGRLKQAVIEEWGFVSVEVGMRGGRMVMAETGGVWPWTVLCLAVS